MLRIGERQSHQPLLAAERALIEPAGLLGATREIVDQRLVIAKIELRPFRLLETIDLAERAIDIANGEFGPGDGERAGHLTDETDGGQLEALAGFGELAALGRVGTKDEPADAMRGVQGEQPARHVQRLGDAGLRRRP